MPYIDHPDATLGRSGRSHFFMPHEDSLDVVDAASAYRLSGGAPSVATAYRSGGEVYGVEFSLDGFSPRLPTYQDAGGHLHFLPGVILRYDCQTAGDLW